MMSAALAAPPGESEPTPAESDFPQLVFENLHALEVTAVRLARERDAALEDARRAEADATGLLRANLALQAVIDEYNTDRRSYLETIAGLRAANAQLAEQVAAADDAPRRGRWRR
jgi:hypothetical protein